MVQSILLRTRHAFSGRQGGQLNAYLVLHKPADVQTSVFSFPNESANNLPTLLGWWAWLAWTRNPKREPGPVHGVTSPTALHRAHPRRIRTRKLRRKEGLGNISCIEENKK